MDYSEIKQEGSVTQSYAEGYYRARSFPVSCADRTIGPWSAWTPTGAYYGTWRLTASNRTPGYWSKKKRGDWIPPNIFYSTLQVREAVGMSDFVHTWHPATCSAPAILAWDEFQGKLMTARVGNIVVIGALTNDNASASLVTQVVTECLANRQKGIANYVESLAELDQVFRLVRSPLGNLGKFANEFSRSRSYRRLEVLRKRFPGVRYPSQLSPGARRTRLGKEFLSLLSGEYLRWRYGVRPLISDVQAAMKALKTTYKANTHADYHTARANGMLQGTKVDKYSLTNSIWTLRWEILRTETYSIRAQWVDQYQATPWTDLGLTWHNLIAVPWELTRRSFVLDWFVNVGEVIYANLPRVGVTPKGGSYFSKRQIYNLAYWTGWTEVDPTTVTVSGSLSDTVQISFTEKRRQLIDRTRDTGFVIKSDFRFDQWTRALDAASLTVQQLLKVQF